LIFGSSDIYTQKQSCGGIYSYKYPYAWDVAAAKEIAIGVDVLFEGSGENLKSVINIYGQHFFLV
tara:strand:+ start:43 stop:237 length:195 start_codon:yes stop_codon:yes gene_type:complete